MCHRIHWKRTWRRECPVELFAKREVKPERRLIEDQQFSIDGHNQGEVQLDDHTLGQFHHFAIAPDGGFRDKSFGPRSIESRMDRDVALISRIRVSRLH